MWLLDDNDLVSAVCIKEEWNLMIRFVMEVSKVQTSKQNTPIVPEGTPDISGGSSAESVRAAGVEPKKDR